MEADSFNLTVTLSSRH